MTERHLVQTLGSLEGRLDDVRREQSWRAIDRALDAAATAPVAPTRPARRFAWPIAFGLAAAAAAVLAVLLVRTPSSLAVAPTELVAASGQRTVLDRDGITLTLVGPGAATIDRTDDAVRVRVGHGTLVADRADTAPSLAITAGGTTTTSRDRKFAVHVSAQTIVLGADERADQIVARYALLETPSPSPSPSPMLNPTPNPMQVPTPTPTPAPNPSSTPNPPPSPSATPLSSNHASAKTTAPATPAAPERPTASSPASEPSTATASSAAPDATPSRPVPSLPEVKLDAVELYRRAETSLAIHDPITARALLEQLLRDYPEHALVDAARYDLALMARTYGERARALELLAQIRTSGRDANIRAAATRLEEQLRGSR